MRRKRRTEESLEAFVERSEFVNEQTRALAGIKIDELGIIGLLERFEAFIDALNERFGVRMSLSHRKDGGLLKDIRARLVGAAIRRRIEALNSADMELYAKAARLAPGAARGAPARRLPAAARPG
jgi:hypothetical protein